MATNELHVPSIISSGNVRMNTRYAMTRAQVDDLIIKMSTSGYIDGVAKLFSDPIQNLISLICFPFDVKAASPTWSSFTDEKIMISIVELDTYACALGNLPTPLFDLGSIAISPHFNNFLDYPPYTKIELYLPFIGFEELDVNVVMGKTISIKYAVDLYSGKCTAFVSINVGQSEKIIMIRDGQCGIQIQIAGGSTAEVVRNMVGIGLKAATGAITMIGGAVAAGASAAGASVGAVASTAGTAAGWLGGTTAGALNAGQFHVHKGGTMNGATSAYAPTTAYLIYTRPIPAEPASYAEMYGYPYGTTAVIGDLSGFTLVDAVHVEGSGFNSATEDERNEITKLLKTGVLL